MAQTPQPLETHVVHPHEEHPHLHTIIALHPKCSDGKEFSRELDLAALRAKMLYEPPDAGDDEAAAAIDFFAKSCRWVFPSAPFADADRAGKREWFNMAGALGPYDVDYAWAPTRDFGDATLASQPRLRESVRRVLDVVRREEELLGAGSGSRSMFLGGFGQGFCVALGAFFSRGDGNLGGLWGVNGWLPFEKVVRAVDARHEAERGMAFGPLDLFYIYRTLVDSDHQEELDQFNREMEYAGGGGGDDGDDDDGGGLPGAADLDDFLRLNGTSPPPPPPPRRRRQETRRPDLAQRLLDRSPMTPLFVGHSVDNDEVPVEHARAMFNHLKPSWMESHVAIYEWEALPTRFFRAHPYTSISNPGVVAELAHFLFAHRNEDDAYHDARVSYRRSHMAMPLRRPPVWPFDHPDVVKLWSL